MPLRIVIDVRHVKDFGIGTYIRNLIRALSALDTTPHYILTARPDDVEEFSSLPPNFETVVYHGIEGHWMNHLAYPYFVRRFAAHLVHVPLNNVPLLLPRPYVVTIHDMSSVLFERRSGWRDSFRLHRFRRGLLRAERIIAVSAATRRDVQNLLGIPSSRIKLVYNAPDPKFLDRVTAGGRSGGPDAGTLEKRRVLERYQINYPFLLYAGRIRPHKNIPRLVEAFAVLRSELEHHPVYRELKLIIIGDEISRNPEVRRAVIQTRVEPHVRFLGFVPFDTLKVFYSSSAAFVFPSLYEGFGLPPLEAMASGTPVVATHVSSLPEVVSDAAMIVNPENVFDIARGIREVLLDENLRQRLIASGYLQLRQFSWERAAAEVLEVYREVAASR
ncbi:MAG: glycosyltransferase family 4 protein [Acidobacteria bacterium]|nr:glycosyltransferase family 4 protein [Acidobacteriota bacterium]MBI3278307.1 glycosyltransferase family 4 protein [Acidobacteriota bacterium]